MRARSSRVRSGVLTRNSGRIADLAIKNRITKELTLLEEIGVVANYSRQVGTVFVTGKVNAPSWPEAETIRRWTDMLREAILRQRVDVGTLQSEPILTWNDKRQNFREWEATDDLSSLALTTLKRLILEYGHLLKACDAPKPRSREKCGIWFLAGRASQLYHDPKCASRVSTQYEEKKEVVKIKRRGTVVAVHRAMKGAQPP